MNCVTENGSALHEACFYGRQDIVRILLDYGIDTTLVNSQGKNVFDLLGQLNTSVSRAIESIIESHANRRALSPLNKSSSLHNCIMPPERYADKNQKSAYNDSLNHVNNHVNSHMNSKLVAYAAKASQVYPPVADLQPAALQPPKQFAQQSYYPDNKFNSSHRPRRKVSPSEANHQSLNNNFSRSQDSILDDYLLLADAPTYQQVQRKKKPKPQLSTFVQHSDDIYSSLDEPIYSYPACGADQQPHSLQNDYLEQVYSERQIQPYGSSSSYGYHKSAHNLNRHHQAAPQHYPQQYSQPASAHSRGSTAFSSNGSSMSSRNSQSHHQLNYLSAQKTIYTSSDLNYPMVSSQDSGYSQATYQTLERDYPQDHSICDYSLPSNQPLLRGTGMRRSTSNTSDSYLDSISSAKEPVSLPVNTNSSTLKRYSSVVDELKTNRVRMPMETVQRIKVNPNSNDLYAQVDKQSKARKNSLKSQTQSTGQSSNRIQDLLDFYDQPSKVLKKVEKKEPAPSNHSNQNSNNQSNGSVSKVINHMTNEQLELYAEIEKKVEKSARLNKLASQSSVDQENSLNLRSQTNENSLNLRSQATFVKAKLNREKRATIAITLNENELDEMHKFEGKPPDAKHAANQISKILRPIHENYKKIKLKPNKQTMTDEKVFGKFLAGKKMVIIERDTQCKKLLVDQNVGTSDQETVDETDKTLIRKEPDEVKRNKPKTSDLIDLDELKKLEEKFNEIKSAGSTVNSTGDSKVNSTANSNANSNANSTVNSTVNSAVNSMNRPRRPAPLPPRPKHATAPKKDPPPVADQTLRPSDAADQTLRPSEVGDKILDKIDKNLSGKEKDLLTKTLNLPLNLDWKHDPLNLYKQTCHYLAFYLGTSKVKNLQGAASSQQCIRDYRKLLNDNQLPSLAAVIISISYKSVRCVDMNCKIINEHEIRTVHYACQDIDQFRFFAYVTKDPEERGSFNCHVFSACSLEMTSEILLTLAQAFEIAFRLNNGETIDQLRKQYVKLNVNRRNAEKAKEKVPSPPLRHSSYSLDRSGNLSKSLSESQFNQLLISAANGFRSSRKLKPEHVKNGDAKDDPPPFRPRQVISASNSIKSIKSVRSESNYNRRKSLQSAIPQMSSLSQLNQPPRPAKPAKPPLRHQTSLPESAVHSFLLSSKRANNPLPTAKPMVPVKPAQIKR